MIERLWGGPETLIVISTDLSHYHSYEQARAIDGATIERIASFATDIDHEEACGATPLNGLLIFPKQKNLSLKLLAACNSGDTAGGKGRVVGYSAFGALRGRRSVARRGRPHAARAGSRRDRGEARSGKPTAAEPAPG